MTEARTRTIAVDFLARVEGEGGLRVRVKGGDVAEVQFRIFEPPRFFEAMLRGRTYGESPDITSRICGICPIAYQTSAIAAVESAFGTQVSASIQALRRLLFCGEWIESHALHVYLLHAPDFLGYESGVHLARDAPEVVARGLQLKKVGNEIMALLGGREVHPVNMRVGGFYRVPSRSSVRALADRLKWACDAAEETVRWVAGFHFPDWAREYEFVSLRSSQPHYPIEEGRLVSTRGLAISVAEYENWFTEEQVPWSTALQSTLRDHGPYLMGPLARMSLNFDRITPRVRAAADAAGFAPPCRNPFRSIVARSLEILYAAEEALRIVECWQPSDEPATDVIPHAATGFGAVEAPRGTLYQRYRIDEAGFIQAAKIVPPTSQNQKVIESELREYVTNHLELPRVALSRECERVVRNHDPCISCATHFLKLDWEET
jgi:coenzyme F420-reducing hydrogenase alpha subunit